MLRSSLFTYSLLSLLSIAHITHANNVQPNSDTTTPRPLHTIDKAFLAAFALQCAAQSADPLSAQVTIPSWNTSFKSEIGGIGIFTRIGRLLRLTATPQAVIVTSTTEYPKEGSLLVGTTSLASFEEKLSERIKEYVIIRQATNPDKHALTQCTRAVHDDGSSTVTCSIAYELQWFKAILDSFEKEEKN